MGTDEASAREIWCAMGHKTLEKKAGVRVILHMRIDNILVIKKSEGILLSTVQWSTDIKDYINDFDTGTYGKGYLTLQDDGNMVIYDEATNKALWANKGFVFLIIHELEYQ
jgi:hypothetical protein